MKQHLSTLHVLVLCFGIITYSLFYFNGFKTISTDQIQKKICGTTILQQKLLEGRSPIITKQEKLDFQIYQAFADRSNNQGKSSAIYTLPVVVHIIHENGTENISDALVNQGILDLNEAFENTGYYNPSTGVNTEIEFCLAKIDPDGNPSKGITRDNNSLTNLTMETEDVLMKNINRWDPTKYINIWIVKSITSLSSGPGVAGYAYFPSSHGNPEDGIVFESDFMGSTKGRSGVVAHEMGHYLGLYHTFQGGCKNDNCLMDGDRVCDTPPDQTTARVPCTASPNSCSSDVNNTDPNNPLSTDQLDMFWNYMDYGDFNCYTAFTQGQADRMNFTILNIRNSLLGSHNCEEPCPTPIEANFSTNSTTVDVDQNVVFTNLSINGSVYEWLIDGVPFTTTENASYTFPNEGQYKITLIVKNIDPNCFENSFSVIITVICPVVSAFEMSTSPPVLLGETVDFYNNSRGATNYEWYVDDQLYSTDLNINYRFNDLSSKEVCLVAFFNNCVDTSCIFVNVIDKIDCNKSFFKLFGEDQYDEFASCLIPLNGGNILIGGSHENDALLILSDPSGNVIWNRKLDLSLGNEPFRLTDLMQDKDGYVVGIGYKGASKPNFRGLVFKYDAFNDKVVWCRIYNKKSRLWSIVEHSISGNYFLCGGQPDFGGTASEDEATLIEMDKNSGLILPTSLNLYSQSSANLISAITVNNEYYFTGRFTPGAGLEDMRAGIFKFDDQLNNIWSKLYFVRPSNPARLYGAGITHDPSNNTLLNTISGDNKGVGLGVNDGYILNLDLQGNINWLKSYVLSDIQSAIFQEVYIVNDGYIIRGQDRDSKQDNFILKVDKQGEFVWGKGFNNKINSRLGVAVNKSIYIEGDYIYTIINSTENSNTNFVFIKLPLSGQLEENCDLLYDISADVSRINSLFVRDYSVDSYSTSLISNDQNCTTENKITPVINLCDPPCVEICDNGVDDDLDGYIDCFDTECPCDELLCGTTDIETNFSMRLAWQSTKNEVSVGATPIIANLNPLIDDIPEIICGESSSNVKTINSKELLIFRGDGINNNTPRRLNITSGFDMYPDTKPVVGDVNGDGIIELLVVSNDRKIRVFSNYNAASTTIMQEIAVSDLKVTHSDRSPMLADFDGDGISEVYCGNEIYKFDFSGSSTTLSSVLKGSSSYAQMVRRNYEFNSCSPVAMDMLSIDDCNGDPDCEGLELVAGNVIYSIDTKLFDGDGYEIKVQRDLNNLQTQNNFLDGYTSVADINLDGTMDIVVAGKRDNIYGLYIWDKNGLIAFLRKPDNIIEDSFGGLPCIANVYDDTKSGASSDMLEVILSDSKSLICWNLNAAAQTPTTPYWWTLPTNDRSGLTAATVFDFNGDGFGEIVYRDEFELRIMYGGSAPFPVGVDAERNWSKEIAGSGTFDEHPVIADIDNDKQAEIIVTSYTSGGPNSNLFDHRGRLRVFESDPNVGGPWISARPIWNQYNYFVTNVLDNLSIPKEQQLHHLEFPEKNSGYRPLNNFLVQQPILGPDYIPFLPLPDANVAVLEASCLPVDVLVNLEICNIGDAALPINTPLSFYLRNPTTNGSIFHQTEYTQEVILIDQCIIQEFIISNPGNATVFVVANDDNSLPPPFDLSNDFPSTDILECDYTNNIDQFEIIGELMSLDLGPDIEICANGVFTLDAGPGYKSYKWSDLTTESSTTVYGPGIYWVEVEDDCGRIFTDEIEIKLNEATSIELGSDTIFCSAGEVILSVPGFDKYEWFPKTGLDCYNCPTVIVNTQEELNVKVVASTSLGCISSDSIKILVAPEFNIQIDTFICKGDQLEFQNLVFNTDTILNINSKTTFGCDSILSINLVTVDTFLQEIDTFVCAGGTIEFDGTIIPANSTEKFIYTTLTGCDSTYVVNVNSIIPTPIIKDTFACQGSSLLYEGIMIPAGSAEDFIYVGSNGCDSIVSLAVSAIAAIETSLDTFACEGTSLILNGTTIFAGSSDNVFYQAANGCDSILSVNVISTPLLTSNLDTFACEGSPIIYQGTSILAGETSDFNYTGSNGCDSILSVFVLSENNSNSILDTSICIGSSLIYEGEQIEVGESQLFTYSSSNGCDSILEISVQGIDTIFTILNASFCKGDSIEIFGNYETSSGEYSNTLLASNGCDSMMLIILEEISAPVLSLIASNTCPDETTGSIVAELSSQDGPWTYEWNVIGELNNNIQNLSEGNYSVTVTSASDCTTESQINIEYFNLEFVEAQVENIICEGTSEGSILINPDFSGFEFSLDGINFQDQLTFTNLSANTYQLYIRDENGCEYQQEYIIEEANPHSLQLPPDITIELGSSISIKPSTDVVGPVEYNWSPPTNLSCTNCEIPEANPTMDILYTLTITDSLGCMKTEDIWIRVKNDKRIYIPNIFSPNGDFKNDKFTVFTGSEVKTILKMEIYDRWGELVFSGKNFPPSNTNYGWDGKFKNKDVIAGVYVYLIEVNFLDNSIFATTGDLTVIR